MARTVHTVPRKGGPGPASAAVLIAVLLVVLTACLYPLSYADPSPHGPDRAVAVSGAVQADGPRADDGHSAVCPTPVRTSRDVPVDRLTAPLTAVLASHPRPVPPPWSAYGDTRAPRLPCHLHEVTRHQDRAPPALPGT
ncbi:hypothetical protein HLK59_11420 [Streptomyces sp. S3(2020)]|uniref:hypothetical protein n=1 Tax=Streptomyces sp. S3(2020) TaxID=2732044 RepID=UPI0014885C60|nr:hypothetical protein [Streptomyces sp. S3(2020)]NNN30968.1 hypothetical protein [Streptomyces sp. S3(2020)]